MNNHLETLADNAHVITYGGATSALVCWGLTLSDLGVIVSMICAVCGVALQFYVSFRRIRALERDVKATHVVAGAIAEATRVQDNRLADIERKADS